ncbi:hypothetical protein COY95_02715 [Candidatus Woesearchaeota archaeon CG_4_10_14_0_8_um_filter_47_5]|nr:MAG: hypothetical protein COY95_02715 [Candidatus Woesearchaeota archaeon CG_4_10_14_0_8_um_filter_47_5]
MEIRNVQKTGKMFYLYLPTSWCKKYNISGSSKVSVSQDNQGNLVVFPSFVESGEKSVHLALEEMDLEVTQKVIMACFINPADSFKITFQKKMDLGKLLQQKQLLNIELIEAHDKVISCESSISIDKPESLLRTMIRKTKNLLYIMHNSYDKDLVGRYEEDIDKNKILIEKAVIASFTSHTISKLKIIDLYYISQISKNLENMVDSLINIPKENITGFDEITKIINFLEEILKNMHVHEKRELPYQTAVEFAKRVQNLKTPPIKDLMSLYHNRIKVNLESISEVVMDWAITIKLDNG